MGIMSYYEGIRTKVSLAWCVGLALATTAALPTGASAAGTVTVDVVAMDQVIMYNRLGAYNPAGMIFSLSRDVFPFGTSVPGETLANSCASVPCTAGQVQLL